MNKIVKDAFVPTKDEKDSAYSLIAINKYEDDEHNICYGTGLDLSIPKGYIGIIIPADTISQKTFAMVNPFHLIKDEDEEIIIKFKSFHFTRKKEYEVGDVVAKLIVLSVEEADFQDKEETDEVKPENKVENKAEINRKKE